ncbi:TadE/TadG family type IV pilus assembly protein [Phytomonospora sp. NPDC050363]|uniref:TadE/TadG family type IV pilus assembly protein n=1 Tax=Phytomonospora sp. NPDC050363 TaxID=3155642 RepID=UPI0033F24248
MTTRMRRRIDTDDEGSVSLETTIGAFAVSVVIAMVIIFGRYAIASNTIDLAAHDAARAASIARDADAAQRGAQAAAEATLSDQSLTCSTLTVEVDVTGFDIPVGEPAEVTATITCVLDFSDIALPGMPGSATVTATYTSPLDTYRSRT